MPRRPGDLERNDEVYDRIAAWSPEGAETIPPPFHIPSDEERRPRTAEQMAAEALWYHAAAADTADPLPSEPFRFGRFNLDASQIFFATELCVATVNLKPLCPGHVLVIPRRCVATLAELTAEEARELWHAVRQVQVIVMGCHGASACKLGVQDGRDAGQSVPHVHVHLLPCGAQAASTAT